MQAVAAASVCRPAAAAAVCCVLHVCVDGGMLCSRLTGLEEQVGGFDLIYRGGFVKFDQQCTTTSYLGQHTTETQTQGHAQSEHTTSMLVHLSCCMAWQRRTDEEMDKDATQQQQRDKDNSHNAAQHDKFERTSHLAK